MSVYENKKGGGGYLLTSQSDLGGHDTSSLGDETTPRTGAISPGAEPLVPQQPATRGDVQIFILHLLGILKIVKSDRMKYNDLSYKSQT